MCKAVFNTCAHCGNESTMYSFCPMWQEGKLCVSTQNSDATYHISGSKRDSVTETRTLSIPMTPTDGYYNFTINMQDLLEPVFVEDLCKKCVISINRKSKHRSRAEYGPE